MVRVWRGGIAQPFGSKMFHGIWAAHFRWTTKTVLVENNDVEKGFKLLNRYISLCLIHTKYSLNLAIAKEEHWFGCQTKIMTNEIILSQALINGLAEYR
jgi:hypothetical protein